MSPRLSTAAPATTAPSPVLRDSRALARAALERAARRGRPVARRRVMARWAAFLAGRLLWRGLLPALLLTLLGGLALWQAQAQGLLRDHPDLDHAATALRAAVTTHFPTTRPSR